MTPDIQLVATDAAEEPAHSLVLCFDDEGETAKLFERSVDGGTAATLLRHFRSGFISGKYKDHNIVPSETGDTWTLVLGLGKRDQAERKYRFGPSPVGSRDCWSVFSATRRTFHCR